MKRRLTKTRPWTAEEINLLGTAPDAVIARRIGRTLAEIKAQRSALNVAAPGAQRRWSPEELALLGKLPDEEIARRIDRPVGRSTTSKPAKDSSRGARPSEVD